MDENAELMNRIKQGAIGGYRVNSYSEQGGGKENPFMDLALSEAKEEAENILKDGEWHKMKLVSSIAKKYEIDLDRLLEEIGAGISDNDKWVCVEKLNTPDMPVGE